MKIFSSLGRKVSARFSKMRIMGPEDLFAEFFPNFKRKISDCERRLFGRAVKTALYLSRGHFGVKETWTCSLRFGKPRRKKCTYLGNDFLFGVYFTTENNKMFEKAEERKIQNKEKQK